MVLHFGLGEVTEADLPPLPASEEVSVRAA